MLGFAALNANLQAHAVQQRNIGIKKPALVASRSLNLLKI